MVKIVRRFNQERCLIDNLTGERYDFDEHPGVDENNSQIAMLIDGFVTETTTSVTGPYGNYVGYMRKEHAYMTH